MKHAFTRSLLAIGSLLLLGYAASWIPAAAVDSSSTSFFVRQDVNFINGSPTSTSFGLLNGAGQVGTGFSSSTSFGLGAGSLYNILQTVGPTYTQIHYHWRNDDGTEATATSATGGTQDTSLTNMAKNTAKRLRVEISNEGGTAAGFSTQQFRIEYALLSGTCASSTYTDVGAAAGDWDMATSSQLTEAGDTTNISNASGGVTDENARFLTPNGGQRETTSATGAISVPSDTYTELEYAIQPLTAASAGPYCFRVTNAGATSSFAYAIYPTSTVSTGANATPTVSAVSLNHGNPITLTPNATTSVDINFTVTDTDGCTDVFTNGRVTSTAFRSGVAATCTANNLNCYVISGATNNCVGASSANATATVALYYFASATDSSSSFASDTWQVKVDARDAAGAIGSSTATGVELNTLLALNVTTSSINYGTVSASSTTGSVNQSSTIQNAGNASTTLSISGTALVKGSTSVATSSQHYATSSFTYGGLESVLSSTVTALSNFLLTSPTSTLAVQSNVFWGIRIPAGTATGTYAGVNTFSAVFSP
jgi:hypothetical protein